MNFFGNQQHQIIGHLFKPVFTQWVRWHHVSWIHNHIIGFYNHPRIELASSRVTLYPEVLIHTWRHHNQIINDVIYNFVSVTSCIVLLFPGPRSCVNWPALFASEIIYSLCQILVMLLANFSSWQFNFNPCIHSYISPKFEW